VACFDFPRVQAAQTIQLTIITSGEVSILFDDAVAAWECCKIGPFIVFIGESWTQQPISIENWLARASVWEKTTTGSLLLRFIMVSPSSAGIWPSTA
jgi:hypothetical protein